MLLGNRCKQHCRSLLLSVVMHILAGIEFCLSRSQTRPCTSVHTQQLVRTLHPVCAALRSSSRDYSREIGALPTQRPEFMMQMPRNQTLAHFSRSSMLLQCYTLTQSQSHHTAHQARRYYMRLPSPMLWLPRNR